ncbi:gag protease polyprotein [Cucumis melo var. makuwa]|uniref:Gag protease polyprotein n=1 Tax=Cucumis melo var. makuwa TaxID=1194695 RepID=A0A5A7SUE1_CUCMM|nr:gag protease polyprotein [Cucumis melo var. makuwa]
MPVLLLLLLLFNSFTRQTQPPSACFRRLPFPHPHIIDGIPESASDRLQPMSLPPSLSPLPPTISPSSTVFPTPPKTLRGAALFYRRCRTGSYLSFLEGIRDLMLKFSGPTASSFGDSFLYSGGSVERGLDRGHNQVSGKGFPTTGPRIEAGSVVIHRGLHVRVQRGADRRGARRMREGHMDVSGFLYASADVRVQRGADQREAGRMREGHMDASGFLYASADVFWEMPPRRGARRGGRGGRGRGAGCVQPEVQPVAQATDPVAPVTHANLAAMEQRFRDLIMQMREQQQPAPPAPAPAPAPVPVVPQVVLDQLSAEVKHLWDFRKYNPTTFDGSLEDPTKAQLWLSSLETIFQYMKCPEDQKVQCAVFMLTDRGTAWWETTERMLGGDVSQITWQQFKESFYAKFFSASLRDAKWQEFLNLE